MRAVAAGDLQLLHETRHPALDDRVPVAARLLAERAREGTSSRIRSSR